MDIRFQPDSSPGPFSGDALDELVELKQSDIPDFAIDPEYLNFAREQNGGRPVGMRFVVPDNSEWGVDVFLHFCDSEEVNEIHVHHHILEFLDNVEEQLSSPAILPFAVVSGGNFLCFNHTGESKYPQVVIFLLESGSTIFVASSFREFLALCSDNSNAKE